MASLPKLEPEQHDPGQELDLARVGTPEFEEEYRRQISILAEHNRETAAFGGWETDWAALDSWK